MLQGVIFDMDGTLLDTMFYWGRVGEIYLRRLGKEPKPGLGQTMLSFPMKEGAEYLQNEYGLALTVDEILQGIRAVCDDFYRDEAQFKPGAREFMARLREKGIPFVLATATDRDQVELAMKRLGVLEDFHCILTSGEVGSSKDEPDIYLKAAEVMGTVPEETWVFEDAIHAARTAKRAGFKLVGVYDESAQEIQQELRELSDYYVYDLTDFDGFYRTAMQ